MCRPRIARRAKLDALDESKCVSASLLGRAIAHPYWPSKSASGGAVTRLISAHGIRSWVGLGAALSQRFAAEGHHVIVVGRTLGHISSVVDSIMEQGGSAESIEADATSEDDIKRVFEHASCKRPTGKHPIS